MPTPPLQPNFENCTLEELETASKVAPTLKAYQRFFAIILLGKGFDHDAVAEGFSITRRTLYNWIRRFNERGIDGLLEGPRPGRPRKIKEGKRKQYRELVEHPEKAGYAHWTGKKFHGYLRDKLQEEWSYRTTVRFFHEEGFRLKVPQPWPDRQDEEKRKAFVEWLCKADDDPNIELWFCDEMGVEGDPRPRRRWIQRGEKGRVTKNGDHVRMNVMGMVCPRTGEFFGCQFSHSDRDCFQAYLDEANQTFGFNSHRHLLIMDNASWHKCKSIEWGRFEPVYLPAYSPDLNPIERLWLILKAEFFTDHISKTREKLIDRLDEALLWLIARREKNQGTCRIKKEL
jgi:transposase